MPLPGLNRDAMTVTRPGTAADSEGNPTDVLASVTLVTPYGTYGTVSATEQQAAQQRQQTIDAVVATDAANDIRVNDFLTIRNVQYQVVEVRDVRTHNRIFVRSGT